MLNRLILLASLIAAAIIMVMLFCTTPTGVGPLGVFVFFTMIYIVVFGVATLALKIFTRTVQRRKELKKKDYAEAGLIAFWPIMVLISISIGVNNLLLSMLAATVFVVVGILLVNKLR